MKYSLMEENERYKSIPKTISPRMLGGKRLVQTQGYVPLNKRIMQLMEAGVRLASSRAEQYDADSKTPPEEIAANYIRRLETLEGLYQTTQIKSYLANKRREQNEQMQKQKARAERERLNKERLEKAATQISNQLLEEVNQQTLPM